MLGGTKFAAPNDSKPYAPTMHAAPPIAAAALGFALLFAAIIAPRVLTIKPSAAAATAVLALALIALSAWDVTTFRLPDALTLPLIVVGIAMASPELMPWRALSAVASGGALLAFALIYKRMRHRDGMGLGDVKLFAAAGAWVGLEGISSVLLIACAAAIFTVSVLNILKSKVRFTDHIAFGPFLAVGLWIVWLYGPIDLPAI